jgi:site-specific DNA-cytosine methylase
MLDRGFQPLVEFSNLSTVQKKLLSGRDFLQIRDAARLLGVTEKTLRNWDRAGHLRAHRHPINGYRLYRVGDLHALLDRLSELPGGELPSAEQFSLTLLESSGGKVAAAPVAAELPPCHWKRDVALDPKHRPQKWTSPATTVRRDWRKFPQEAHVLDHDEKRYRRLTVDEIALIQGFDPSTVDLPELSERQRIGVLGDAVPPPLATALVKGIAKERTWQQPTVLEICAGIGGLAHGAAAAGLEHLLLIDASDACAMILRHRRSWPEDRVVEGDVRRHDFMPFAGRVGLLSGGPPCQPWSLSGLRGGDADRRDLLGTMPELVATVRPEVFLLENVPGLAMFANGRYLNDLIWRLREPAPGTSYGVLVALLNAADFGVPQIRKRLFILGIRDEPGASAARCFARAAELATHRDPSSPDDGRQAWRTVGDVLVEREDPGGWRRWIGGGLD